MHSIQNEGTRLWKSRLRDFCHSGGRVVAHLDGICGADLVHELLGEGLLSAILCRGWHIEVEALRGNPSFFEHTDSALARESLRTCGAFQHPGGWILPEALAEWSIPLATHRGWVGKAKSAKVPTFAWEWSNTVTEAMAIREQLLTGEPLASPGADALVKLILWIETHRLNGVRVGRLLINHPKGDPLSIIRAVAPLEWDWEEKNT